MSFFFRVGLMSSGQGFRGLLDEYPGAAAAYSLRVLHSDFTDSAVVKVRRSSDNAESDFTANEITDGTLTTWTGANDGFVVTWYDQSGNGRDATQAIAGGQPQIVDTGSLVMANGLPIIDGAGASGGSGNLTTSPISIGYSGNDFACYAGDRSNSISGRAVFSVNGGLTDGGGFVNSLSGFGWNKNLTTYNPTTGVIYLWSGESSASNSKTYENGVLKLTDNTPLNSGMVTINIFITGSRPNPSRAYEIIYYNTDQSANRTGIESNINDSYGIY